MQNFFVLSGCSGGGKSTLLKELGRRGYATVEEPGRRIVREEQARGGTALPWADFDAFVERLVEVAAADHERMRGSSEPVFFDRSLLDAFNAFLQEGEGVPTEHKGLLVSHAYAPKVFLTPPWPEIYERDAERRHGLADGIAEYEALLINLPEMGYEPVLVPKGPVEERADFILSHIKQRLE